MLRWKVALEFLLKKRPFLSGIPVIKLKMSICQRQNSAASHSDMIVVGTLGSYQE